VARLAGVSLWLATRVSPESAAVELRAVSQIEGNAQPLLQNKANHR